MDYEDFTHETVWEQLRVIAWISTATLATLCMIMAVAL